MYSAWLTRMSELWRFVYIKSHMTLHVKPNAEKVNCLHAQIRDCSNILNDGDWGREDRGWGVVPGGVLRYISDGDVGRGLFWGLKFCRDFFWVRDFGKDLFLLLTKSETQGSRF